MEKSLSNNWRFNIIQILEIKLKILNRMLPSKHNWDNSYHWFYIISNWQILFQFHLSIWKSSHDRWLCSTIPLTKYTSSTVGFAKSNFLIISNQSFEYTKNLNTNGNHILLKSKSNQFSSCCSLKKRLDKMKGRSQLFLALSVLSWTDGLLLITCFEKTQITFHNNSVQDDSNNHH